MTAPRWVGWWFRGAGIYGIIVLLAVFASPPPSTAPLYYYGFAGTAFAFQIAFLMIGADPVRYRSLMLAAVLEKLAFVVPVLLLDHKLDANGVAGAIDLVLGIGFLAAWRVTPT